MSKELSVVTKYNHLYFDETKRMTGDVRNSTFWQKLNDLQNKYPDTNITVELSLSRDFGEFYETATIFCDEEKIKGIAEQILRQDYCLVRLQLYPDFEGKEDVLKILNTTR